MTVNYPYLTHARALADVLVRGDRFEMEGELARLLRAIEDHGPHSGGGGGRAATIVVAASDSTAKSKAGADLLCTGTNDHLKLQEAVNALPAVGGRILLLEGTYNLAGQVDLSSKTRVSIVGLGGSTQLVSSYNGTTFYKSGVSGAERFEFADFAITWSGGGSASVAIQVLRADYVIVRNVQALASPHATLATATFMFDSNVNDLRVHGCTITGTNVNNANAIRCVGVLRIHITDNTIRSIQVAGGSNNGIQVEPGSTSRASDRIHIAGNTIEEAGYGVNLLTVYNNAGTGITARYAIIEGNVIKSCRVAGIQYTTDTSIGLGTVKSQAVIRGNLIYDDGTADFGTGMIVSSESVIVEGNQIFSTRQHGLQLTDADRCIVQGNHIENCGQATANTYSGIHVNVGTAGGGVDTFIHGNLVRGTSHKWGIRVDAAGVTGTLVVNNDIKGSGATASYSDVGTGTLFNMDGSANNWNRL